MLGIGIDTGGTCTDAVVYDFDAGKILDSGKALTTKQNLEIGIANALDALPRELVARAENIALSTTLATNACVENTGARAKMLLIGFKEDLMEHLREVFASYGMRDMTQFLVLDARSEGVFSRPYDPDWEDLRRNAGTYFADCDSVAVVQQYPKSNAGRFELTALKILREELDIPVTISYDISNEVDILKTCAGTLLNAMLIPLISGFMGAIRHVCDSRGLHIPVSIILSNGTMAPAESAMQFPVETILCGPAASVVGGSALAGEKDGFIVDMGGTTTDIAVIRDNVPVPAAEGIRIGQWKTMVQGIYVNTIGLGGDSAVTFQSHSLRLESRRVVPLSVLAAEYENVLPTLTALRQERKFCGQEEYTFIVPVRDIAGRQGYTDQEQQLCALLKDGPLTIPVLADRLGCARRFLPLSRLEADGVILRGGLTPTDMMILKGDFDLYDSRAAAIGAWYLAAAAECSVEELPDMVYELVERKMYHALGRLILSRQFSDIRELDDPAYLERILDAAYRQACERADAPDRAAAAEGSLRLTTRMPLIGVGAPIHIFLPRVAQLLETRAVVPKYAGVANALGAVVSRRIAKTELVIHAAYENGRLIGFDLPDEGMSRFFKTREEAEAYGREAIFRTITKKAKLHGIVTEPRVQIYEEDVRIGHKESGMILEIRLTAVATESVS